jgi:hypothetical protein
LGKNNNHARKNGNARLIEFEGLMKYTDSIKGIHAKKRFHIRYARPVALKKSPRDILKINPISEAMKRDWVIFEVSIRIVYQQID